MRELIRFRNGYFLGAEEAGDIIVRRAEDFSQGDLQTYGKWKIVSKDQVETQRNLKSIDEILLRSPYGNFLKVTSNGELVATSAPNDKACVFSISKASIPPFPQWVHTRPYISAANLIPEFVRYTNDQNNTRISDRYEASMYNDHDK